MWKAESLLSQLAHSWKQVPVQRFAFRHCSWQCHFKTVGQKGKDRDQYRDTSSKWTSKGSCHSLQETKKTLKRTSPATSWEMKGSYCLRVFKNTYNVASFLLDSMFQNARAKRWYARDVWEFILEPFDFTNTRVLIKNNVPTSLTSGGLQFGLQTLNTMDGREGRFKPLGPLLKS